MKDGLPDLIPDVIPEQKKPLEEPFSKNDEDDLDEDDYDDFTNKELIYTGLYVGVLD